MPKRPDVLKEAGFTLVELMVVVMILGILAFMGIPQYMKTVESSKADDAVATMNMLGQANRMYNLNNPGNWSTANPMANTDILITGNYVAGQDWGNKPWNFVTCNPQTGAGGGNCAVGIVAWANRNSSAQSPYSTWGYTLSNTGLITCLPSACGSVNTAPTPAK